MRAITLWEPWASLIKIGAKTIETRSWKTKYRGPLAIHAAKRWGPDQKEFYFSEEVQRILNKYRFDFTEPLPLGCVVCVVNLRNCIRLDNHYVPHDERHCGDFTNGRYAWKLDMIEVLDVPLLAKGSQGFWEWDK